MLFHLVTAMQAIDIRFLNFNMSELTLIRNILAERVVKNSNRIVELGVEYFDQVIDYKSYFYNVDPLEQENCQLENMISYIDSVQYPNNFIDHEDMIFDED